MNKVFDNLDVVVSSVGGGFSSTLFLPLHLQLVDKYKNVDYVIAALPDEDPDVWRLIESVEGLLDIQIKRIGLGKSVWDIFFEQNFIGNSRLDNCSRTLKRDVMRAYMKDNYPVGGDVKAGLALGIGYHEIDRELSIRGNWLKNGYPVYFPLDQYPNVDRKFMMETCRSLFGFVPSLYEDDFEHNNCGGACIKAGKYQWLLLLIKRPLTFKMWEDNEREWRRRNPHLNRTVLRVMKKGIYYPLTFEEFRIQMMEKGKIDADRVEAVRAVFPSWELTHVPTIVEEITLDDTPGCSFCDSAGGGYEDLEETELLSS